MKKSLSLALAGTVLTAALAGCGAPKGESTPAPTATPEITTPAPALEGLPGDVAQEVLGVPGSTAVMTVDGAEVSAQELLYWLSYSADQYNQYGLLDWTMEMDGAGMGDYLLNNAVETAKLHAVVQNHAQDQGIALTAEDQVDFDSQIASLKSSMAAQLGGEGDQAYQYWLKYIGLDDDHFRQVNQISYLVQHLRDRMFGESGANPPPTDGYAAWAEDNGVYRAKHILIGAEDKTDEAMAAALDTANAIRQDLKDNGDTEAYFDTVMAEKSQDPGSQSNPDGYVFGAGEMVDAFYQGAAALSVGQISDPVQSSYGYHIILRLGVDPSSQEAKDKYADVEMEKAVDQWVADAKTETTAAYDQFDPENDYGKLTEVRAQVMAAMQAAFAPQETTPAETEPPAPTATPAG